MFQRGESSLKNAVLLIAIILTYRFVAQAQFTGFVKPLDWAPYDGSAFDGGPYSTVYRGNYSFGPEGSGSHPGVDIVRDRTGVHLTSSSEVRAIYGGVIERRTIDGKRDYGWGNSLVIRHTGIPELGSSGVFFSTYAHLDSLAVNPVDGVPWNEGHNVSKGDLLGFVGATGSASGTHLHFQIDRDYSDYPLHPFWPDRTDGTDDAHIEISVPDSDNLVLSHAANPVPFVESHLAPVPPGVCTVPPSGVVAWWPADGNASDIVGSNDGTLNGNVTFVTGMVDQAFSFDGASFVRVPNHSSLEPTHVTVEGWVRGDPQGSNHSILSKGRLSGGCGSAVGDISYGLYTAGPGGLFFCIFDSAWFQRVCAGVPPERVWDGQWHHVAGSLDGSNVRVYLDGQPGEISFNPTFTILYGLPASNELFIGWDTVQCPLQSFRGEIDELTIYNRALSDAEIQAIFTASSAGKCK